MQRERADVSERLQIRAEYINQYTMARAAGATRPKIVGVESKQIDADPGRVSVSPCQFLRIRKVAPVAHHLANLAFDEARSSAMAWS